MSGGSFNYLFCKSAADVLASGMGDLDDMAAELEAMGYVAKDVAERTRELFAKLRAAEDEWDAELKALGEVWRAVEWWRSCDSSRDQVLVEIGKYRERLSASKRTEGQR